MSCLGKTLQRVKQKKLRACRENFDSVIRAITNLAPETPSGNDSGKKLKSIWETNNMDEFLAIADEREAGYMAERNVRVVVDGRVHVVQKDNRIVPHTNERDWYKLSEQLSIPKRPEWSFDTPAETVQASEKAMFLDWRRQLATMEEKEGVLMTPYEKNLEVWRQLWRVVERADVVLEIVDARNPLAFRSRDFEDYVLSHKTRDHSISKQVVLLLNKSDLLTVNQRKAWANYLTSKGMPFFFFAANPVVPEEPSSSAEKETDEKEPEHSDSDGDEVPLNQNVSNEDRVVQNLMRNKKEKSRHQHKKLRGAPVQYVHPYELLDRRKEEKERKNAEKFSPPPKPVAPLTQTEMSRTQRMLEEKLESFQPWDVLSAVDLLDHLSLLRAPMGITDDNTPLMVGLVGYPNVGKSSTINAILGCKKVVVSATPGKTKHFQTLVIPNERRLMLCDCPGLVFPSFASTREQMVCDGILPVDTVKDYVSPISVLCQRIPRQVLEDFYSVSLTPDADMDESTSLADRLLNIVARRKGYMTEHDKPNRSRIAKELLKLYVEGHFVYAHPPPGLHIELPKDWDQVEEPAEGEDEELPDAAAWEDLDSADEARALSEGSYVEDAMETEMSPLFFARPRGAGVMTQAEIFNIENNLARMDAAREAAAKCPKRKPRKNHQLDPEEGTFINRQGEVELRIDDDDGIVQLDYVGPACVALNKPKTKSKRQTRREMKRAGVDGPVNTHTRVIGFCSK